jgi:membrane-bound ClpP family serine protease
MVLLFAILIILFEAIGEGLLKRYSLANWVFNPIIQWVIALVLFGVWFIVCDAWDIKPILGFIFVRFMIFDVIYNLTAGNKWYYYGTRKFYDKTMTKLASWGWFIKVVLGVVGIAFLLQ